MSKFKIKQPPKKPTREKIHRRRSLNDGETLQEIIKNIPPDAVFTLELYGYDGGEARFDFMQDETDEAFNLRLEKYQKDLAKYLEWESKNKDNIAKHIRDQNEKAKEEMIRQQEQLTREREARKRALEKELETLNRQLRIDELKTKRKNKDIGA